MMKWGFNSFNNKDKGIESRFNTLSIKKIIIISIILVIFLSSIPIRILLALDYKSGDYIKSWRIEDEDTFIVEHTHSVQLTPVSEKYAIERQDIILIEAKFHSFGAGLPATSPYKFEISDQGFRIYDINQKMNDLVYRTGSERANHRLIIDNRYYYFLDFTEVGTGLRFVVDRTPYIYFIIREGFF